MKFSYNDIPKFTRNANYRVNSPWDFLEKNLAHWSEVDGGIAAVNLNPDFQRVHVWTPAQQTAYVEYILRGGISGREIYFNCVGWMGSFKGPFVLVDGKQRVEAVRAFLRNEVPIFGGHKYSEIEGTMRMTDANFLFCVNDLKTEKEVLQWYLDLNTGGTPHTNDEIEKVKAMLAATK